MKSKKIIIQELKKIHNHYSDETKIGKDGFGAEEQEFEAGQMVALAWVLGISTNEVMKKYSKPQVRSIT